MSLRADACREGSLLAIAAQEAASKLAAAKKEGTALADELKEAEATSAALGIWLYANASELVMSATRVTAMELENDLATRLNIANPHKLLELPPKEPTEEG